ncbi:hypothetical protein LSH36_162g08025 [Paralvinella palmiformis]|uniref:Uncharacterized protein n=1 Tax=Paralvinella palmiformis TaxID=53620 RepID=A0AAD9N836_9ANNE|nr:hypothetical protein LSH36_162g08025 [Paralvinella palmiformis]
MARLSGCPLIHLLPSSPGKYRYLEYMRSICRAMFLLCCFRVVLDADCSSGCEGCKTVSKRYYPCRDICQLLMLLLFYLSSEYSCRLCRCVNIR